MRSDEDKITKRLDRFQIKEDTPQEVVMIKQWVGMGRGDQTISMFPWRYEWDRKIPTPILSLTPSS